MDAKKKIVELIAQKVCDTWSESCDEWLPRDCGKCYANDCHISELADHLIANGVTVQECGYWVSLTDCANAGVYCSVCNKKVYKEDYAWCNRKNKLRSDYCPHCGVRMDGRRLEGKENETEELG